MSKLYVNILVGERAADATSVLATSDPDIVRAVVDAVIAKLRDPERETILQRLAGAGQDFSA